MNGEPGDRRVWSQDGMLACAAGTLRFAACGAGAPLVLLPKLGGAIPEWRHVAPGLGRHLRVVAIDPLGHGGSAMATAAPYVVTVEEHAAAIVAGLDSLGIRHFSLAGCSLGGCIGISIAALWPERLDKLALLSVSMARRMSEAEEDRREIASREAFDQSGMPLPRSAADMARFGTMREDVIAEQNATRAQAGLWLRPSERGVGRFGIEEHLSRIKADTLVMQAQSGHYVQYIDAARRHIGQIRCETILESGPFMHQEQPERTLACLLGFFKRS
jgi:pimeloyl-ACP methyl ester carboxylesterase